MDAVIAEINESLKKILKDLEDKKEASSKALDQVNNKINEKVDEAKKHKIDVDNTKLKIKNLEQEISGLEIDLTDLNERFGKKDLNAIVDAGNREINTKIIEKQNQITKYRQKIGELTEKARSIKDLLISLKKDKISKEERLEILSNAFEYYSKALTKTIEFAKENPNSLDTLDLKFNQETYAEYDYSADADNNTRVFAEIDALDDEDDDQSDDTLEKSLIDSEEDVDLSEIYNKIKIQTSNFEELSDSIDEEFNSIFGDRPEIKLDDETESDAPFINVTENELNEKNDSAEKQPEELQPLAEPIEVKSISEEVKLEPAPESIPDFFGNNLSAIPEQLANEDEIKDLFNKYEIDFTKFSTEDQEILKNIFSADTFTKTLDVLKDNHLNIEKINNVAPIFSEITPEDLNSLISKLLLANQSSATIELILDSLPLVNINSLTDVINNYGEEIKNANIADIIFKTKPFNKEITKENKWQYLLNFGFTEEEIKNIPATANKNALEMLELFPALVSVNYELLKDIGITNLKEVFLGHPHMFLINSDRFSAIFAKYDQDDLIRCVAKNAAVIEKL